MRFIKKLHPEEKQREALKNPQAGWVIAAGISMNGFSVKGNNETEATRASFESSFAPLLSLSYVIPTSRNFSRTFFQPQLKFYSYKNTGTYKANSATYVSTYKASLVSTFGANGGVNLINKEKARLFVSGGAGLMILLNNKRIEEKIAETSYQSYYYEASLPGIGYYINAAAGVTLKDKIVCAINYNFPSMVTNFIYYTPSLSSLQLTIGYKLRR